MTALDLAGGGPRLQAMSVAELLALADALQRAHEARRYDWHLHARDNQREPADYIVWLLMAGRGFGKSRVGSETVRGWAEARPGHYAVIAKNDREVKNVCFEGPAGLVNVIPPNLIKSYNKSGGNTFIVLTNGSVIRAFSAERPDNLRGYAFDGAWCVAAGELVTTARGQVPIEEVTPGDRVWTRAGWRPVTAAGMTKPDAEVLRIVTEYGVVTCTPDHVVWVDGRWDRAENVRPSSKMVAWSDSPTRPQDPPPTSSGPGSAGTATPRTATTATAAASCCTSLSGSTPTGPSPTATTSTTTITTARTTPCPTCVCSTPRSTGATTRPSAATRHGTGPTSSPVPLPMPCGPTGNPGPSSAPNAAPSTSAPACGPSCAPCPAGELGAGGWRPSAVLRVEPAPRADVYDLTVEGAHEFLAGGLLVHNCDEFAAWSRRTAQDTWDNLQFCMREARVPHIVVTTTPQNVPHVRDLLVKCEGNPAKDQAPEPGHIVTRGKTTDNAANLSPAMLRELEHRYEGTRVGRQELDGELLTDSEFSLWSLATISAVQWRPERHGPRPTEYVETVTVVDPSGSEKGDATGIVTVARGKRAEDAPAALGAGMPGEQGPIFVLSDDTTNGTPEHRSQTACLAAYRHASGVLLYEATFGGDHNEAGLRAAWQELIRTGKLPGDAVMPRLQPAPAKGSKADRAQPVAALYEQTANAERDVAGTGRIYHLVPLPLLEDEQTTWEPQKNWSPNRLDAVVHGVRYLTRTAGYQAKTTSAVGIRPAGSSRLMRPGAPGMPTRRGR